jgi:hypothetical protein
MPGFRVTGAALDRIPAMLPLALVGLLAAILSVVAMSGAIVPLHGAAFEMASITFLIATICSTLGFAASDG